jgi:molybdopterin-guanine dinucleotide biosynthesis protein A
MEQIPAHRAPLLQSGVSDQARRQPAQPLRACLLSGGESRRMGRDKALLPHPEGGTWLERTLQLLSALELPITLFSRHEAHRQLARTWADSGVGTGVGTEGPAAAAALEAIAEPPPWEGPLLALLRLIERYPGERLLLCPVDMPTLNTETLAELLTAAAAEPTAIHLADDGARLQPLLAVLPASPRLQADLAAAVAGGERRLQRWLTRQPHRAVRLDPAALCNCNRPEEIPRTTEASPTLTSGAAAGDDRPKRPG